MKRGVLLTLILLIFAADMLPAQNSRRGMRSVSYELTPGNDTLPVIEIIQIPVFRRKVDTRRYIKMINNLKAVYPIALEAEKTLNDMEEHLASLPNQKARDEYVKLMELILKKKYTPVLKKMTFSQGKILIKLIDRQTSHTSYELVKDLRGGFSAFFYQNIARLFGANLKDRFDRDGEDQIIEQLIILYESGMI